MLETDEEIRDIKKEIIESRGLTIKTNNLVNALGADVKSIAKRQAGYERRFNWNGAVAFVLFATLSFVGLMLASDARISEIRSEQSNLVQEVAELRDSLSEETRRAEERARAEGKAWQFYELIRQRKRAEVVAGYEALQAEQLSRAEAAFFRDIYEQHGLDLSVKAYQAGLDLLRTGRYAEAADKLQESVRLKDNAAHIPKVKYELARALRKLGRQTEASVVAREVMEQTTDREIQDDATWLLSLCAEESGDLNGARTALRTLIRKWPRSMHSPDARPKIRELNQRINRGDR